MSSTEESSVAFSQPRIMEFMLRGSNGDQNTTSDRVLRSKSTHSDAMRLPEKDVNRKSKNQRKAENKKKRKSRRSDPDSRNPSGDSISIISQSESQSGPQPSSNDDTNSLSPPQSPSSLLQPSPTPSPHPPPHPPDDSLQS